MKKKDTGHPRTKTFAPIVVPAKLVKMKNEEVWKRYFREARKVQKRSHREMEQDLHRQLYGE
jgi:hypothetical protein